MSERQKNEMETAQDFKKEKKGYCPITNRKYPIVLCTAWNDAERISCKFFEQGNQTCRHFARFNDRDLQCLRRD